MATDEKCEGQTAREKADKALMSQTDFCAAMIRHGAGLIEDDELDAARRVGITGQNIIRAAFEAAEDAKLLRFVVERVAEETEDAVGCPASEDHPRLAEICQPEREKWGDDTEEEQDRWDEHCGPCREKGRQCWVRMWLLEAHEALAELDKQAKEAKR